MAGARIGIPPMQRGTKIVLVVIVAASLFAGITLYVESTLRDAFHRQLLVVRATSVVSSNGDAGTGVPADFGPHCANASFAQSGALILDSDVIPANATGVVYVKYEPDDLFAPTRGPGDRVALFFFRSDARAFDIVSTVNVNRTLFRMEDRNASLLIDNVAYGAGQQYRFAFGTGVQYAEFTYLVTETFTVTSLGFTTVTVQPPQPCP